MISIEELCERCATLFRARTRVRDGKTSIGAQEWVSLAGSIAFTALKTMSQVGDAAPKVVLWIYQPLLFNGVFSSVMIEPRLSRTSGSDACCRLSVASGPMCSKAQARAIGWYFCMRVYPLALLLTPCLPR